MSYADMKRRLREGGVAILDGGTGTELERRGARMDPEAWCGPASLDNLKLLQQVHSDYIAAGADIVTANTFASSRLMLEPAGYGERVAEINQAAVGAALDAREARGRPEVLVAGSLSHMCPVVAGEAGADAARAPSADEMADAFGELAEILRAEGCELILLEMMYHPERMAPAFLAAAETGLPVWAGFSARRGADGRVLSYTGERDVPFAETVAALGRLDVDIDVAGVMHTPADLTGEALAVLRQAFDGPLSAYPDSGHFEMPSWKFDPAMSPATLRGYAETWVAENGARVVGGCCGLSPAHIAALARLRA